jgi:molybdopterin/thiamine biosynthesis adenylyltransferase
VVGAGGLGSPVALYLAAAGVGTIGIVDNDVVDLSNLQRQIVHATADVGRHKVESASNTLQALNPEVKVQAHKLKLCADNVMPVIREYDFVVDGTDNFSAKFLVNDACVLTGTPFSHGGVLRFYGQVMTEKGYSLDTRIDIVGTGCPMNLVHAKVELARMDSGQILEIILDDGAPVRNVSRSIQEEGHELLQQNQLNDGTWSVVVRKG